VAYAPGVAEGDGYAVYGKNAAAEITKMLKATAADARSGTLRAALDEMDPKLYPSVVKRAQAIKTTFKKTDDQAMEEALKVEIANSTAFKIYYMGKNNKADQKPLGSFQQGLGSEFGYGYAEMGGIWDTVNKIVNPIEHVKNAIDTTEKLLDADFRGAFKGALAPVYLVPEASWQATQLGAKAAWAGVKWIGHKLYYGLKFVWQTACKIIKWLWDKFCDFQNASWHKTLAMSVGTAIGTFYGGPAGGAAGAKAGQIGDAFGKKICGGGQNPIIAPEGQPNGGAGLLDFLTSPMGLAALAIGGVALFMVTKENG
jgi:hypothetical protein